VAQARRGWLSPEDVLNTRSWRALGKLLKRNWVPTFGDRVWGQWP